MIDISFGELNIQVDPLLVEGIKIHHGFGFLSTFNDLVSFLSELEFQENIILLSDINIQQDDNKQENKDSLNKNNDLLKTSIKISIYGKI